MSHFFGLTRYLADVYIQFRQLPNELQSFYRLKQRHMIILEHIISCTFYNRSRWKKRRKKEEIKSEIAQFAGQVNFLLWHLCRISPVPGRWAIKPNLMSFNDVYIVVARVRVDVTVVGAMLGVHRYTQNFLMEVKVFARCWQRLKKKFAQHTPHI